MKEYLIPEGKSVLLTLIWRGVNDASILELVELCNAPIHEITLGLQSLKSAGINVWRGTDKIILSEDFAQ